MFTATITSKSFALGNMQVYVDFSNGTTTVTRIYNIYSERNLKNEIRNEIARLNELETFSEVLPVGAYDHAENIVPPTQDELDKNKWFRDFNKLQQLTKLNELGALRPNAVSSLTDLRATVSADFKQAYIADM